MPDLSLLRLKWLINKLLKEKKASKETLMKINDELLTLEEKIQNHMMGDSKDPE